MEHRIGQEIIVTNEAAHGERGRIESVGMRQGTPMLSVRLYDDGVLIPVPANGVRPLFSRSSDVNP